MELPVVPLRDMVLFPRMLTPLYVGRDRSLRAVEAALNGDQRLVAVAQSNEDADTPEPQDLYSVGAEITAVARVMPAEGPSLGMPPSGTWM